jgi:hypothetical protein
MSKEEFFKTNNIIEDELDYLGSGDLVKLQYW